MHSVARFVVPLSIAVLACSWPWIRPALSWVGPPFEGQGPASLARDHLRVMSWNLRNFPGDHDLHRIHMHVEALRPTVIAVQEVRSPTALAELLPDYRVHASRNGGRHGQHVAIAWDPSAVTVDRFIEHGALSLDGMVRPALSARVHDGHGAGFDLFVVHLKATRDGHEQRRIQWEILGNEIDNRSAGDPSHVDVMVVGDFNVAGGEGVDEAAELQLLTTTMEQRAFAAWSIEGECTAYWDGVRRDAWQQPSALDGIWTRGFRELEPSKRHAWPGAHCARHRCQPFRSTPHHPDPDVGRVSDHCPVVADVPWPRPSSKEDVDLLF